MYRNNNLYQTKINFSEDETQPTNINESFDVALEELWPLVIKNGLDKTILPDIAEGFSYVIIMPFS